VLLLAGTFEPFDVAEARACGSDGHVTKPFDSRVLVERVEHLLARGAKTPAVVPAVAKAGGDELDEMFDDLAVRATPLGQVPVAARAAPASAATASASATTATDVRPAATTTLSPADIDAIAARVVERLSDRVVREIAWDVVPDLAEIVVRERLRELERESS
jgi:hypothetical protein